MFHRTLQCIAVSGIIMIPGLLFAQPPGRGGPPGGGPGGPGGPPPHEMILRLFKHADADKDGSVTKAELTSAMEELGGRDRRGPGGPPPQQGGPRGENRRPEGPPPREGNEGRRPGPGPGEHGHHGPPPKPGEVLPEPVAHSLNLSEQQTRKLAELQADVNKRLAAILTDEQKEQLENAHPPHGPGHGPGHEEGGRSGGRPASRPQRPQRPE